MKQIARSHVWWPKLDADLEALCKSCKVCQETCNSPAAAPLHPWIWPNKPWVRVHIDFMGPFLDRMFLVVMDAYSKWPEVVEMSTGPSGVTAARIIEELRRIFTIHGLPQQIVSDNGPKFVSEQFTQFLWQNGIKHIKSSPYHPSTNGQTERFIQTLKKALKAGKDEGFLKQRLADFCSVIELHLMQQLRKLPCVLLMGIALHTRLDLLKPNHESQVVD